jgi:phenylacetate-coenzyme A ligase PaaK-like adenylate-forming protein
MARAVDVRREQLLAGLQARLGRGEDLDRLTWPLEKLHAARDERLRAVVTHARQHSPWHAERLRDVDVSTLSGDDLRGLPVMTKADVVAHWDDIVTDRRLTREAAERELERLETPDAEAQPFWCDDFLLMSTGGSSGEPTVVPWDLDGWMEMCAVVMRYGRWLQQHAPAGSGAEVQSGPWVQATIGSSHRRSMSRRLSSFLANPYVENHELPARAPIADTVATLASVQPDGLFGYSTALTMVAFEAMEGRLAVGPKMVGASSEPLTDAMARYLERAFGVAPSNTYAVTELGALAARDFPGISGLALVEDVAVYEPMQRAAHGARRPAGPGEMSDTLIVTPVLNRALPLIRYELDDRVAIDADGPGGPWTGRGIRLGGRLEAELAWPDGPPVDPAAIARAAELHPEVLDLAITQQPRGVRVQLWLADPPVGLLDRMRAELTAAVMAARPDAEVVVEAIDRPDELPRTDAGKRRRVVRLPG